MLPERLARIRSVLDRRQPDLTVLLENVHKPHNFSAIVRTCDAVGVLDAHAVVPARNRIRASQTAKGSGRWVRVHSYPTLEEALRPLRQAGIRVIGAHLGEGAVPFREIDFTRPTAVLFGQEKFGVSPEAVAACDGFLTIPMVGMVESLNVSVAAAVVLYEAERQRQASGYYDAPRLDEASYRRTLFEWLYPEIAAYCQRRGVSYPRLSDEGELLDPLPR